MGGIPGPTAVALRTAPVLGWKAGDGTILTLVAYCCCGSKHKIQQSCLCCCRIIRGLPSRQHNFSAVAGMIQYRLPIVTTSACLRLKFPRVVDEGNEVGFERARSLVSSPKVWKKMKDWAKRKNECLTNSRGRCLLYRMLQAIKQGKRRLDVC